MTWLARPEQRLIEHLESAAIRAEASAAKWDAGAWGRLAGLWHDLGKFSAAFQHYIQPSGDEPRACRGSVNHTSAGAIHARRRFEATGRQPSEWEVLARVIFAHHGALPDRSRYRERLGMLNATAKTAPDQGVPVAMDPKVRFGVTLQIPIDFTKLMQKTCL